MLNRLPSPPGQQLFRELFHPSEMDLSASAASASGASDYATKMYSYDEGEPDPEMRRFSLDHDKEYILPMLRQARGVNPRSVSAGFAVESAGMDEGGRFDAGRLDAQVAFCRLREVLRESARGLRGGRRPAERGDGPERNGYGAGRRMPACLWGQEYEMEFIAAHLGPQLAANHIDTKIWILDHNYNLWGRAIAELDDPKVNKYVDGVAWHGYVGEPGGMTRVHEAHPDKHMYWTEGGSDYNDPRYLTNWAHGAPTSRGILRNWSRCVMGWNLALDEVGKPNIGPFDCGGLVTIDSKTGEITRSGQYWAFTHFSRAMRRGARRIESSGELEGVSHVAFVNPDGSMAAVLTNAAAERKILLRLNGRESEVRLPADSVTTLTWGA